MRILFALMLCLSPVWPAPEKNAPKKKKTAAPVEAISGCVDQRGETYILRSLSEAENVATLRGKAFSDDNFARYVGHKVTVHGARQKEGEVAVVQVIKIDDGGPGCSGQ